MKLTMTIDVDHDIDPTLWDPHVIAEDILSEYEEAQHAGNGLVKVTFVSAEWDEGSG